MLHGIVLAQTGPNLVEMLLPCEVLHYFVCYSQENIQCNLQECHKVRLICSNLLIERV